MSDISNASGYSTDANTKDGIDSDYMQSNNNLPGSYFPTFYVYSIKMLLTNNETTCIIW